MRVGATLFFAALLSCVSVARAAIVDTSWQCHDDGDGAIVCNTSWWPTGGGAYVVSITGDQFSAPGHMLTYFDTNTTEDPTSTVRHYMTNDSDTAWTGYTAAVELYTASPLTSYALSNLAVTNPPANDWSVTGFQQFQLVTSTAPQYPGLPAGLPYEYSGQITFAGGTNIDPGAELDFSYREAFQGSLHYGQVEVLTPTYATPEPGTLALLGGGLLALLVVRRRCAGRTA